MNYVLHPVTRHIPALALAMGMAYQSGRHCGATKPYYSKEKTKRRNKLARRARRVNRSR